MTQEILVRLDSLQHATIVNIPSNRCSGPTKSGWFIRCREQFAPWICMRECTTSLGICGCDQPLYQEKEMLVLPINLSWYQNLPKQNVCWDSQCIAAPGHHLQDFCASSIFGICSIHCAQLRVREKTSRNITAMIWYHNTCFQKHLRYFSHGAECGSRQSLTGELHSKHLKFLLAWVRNVFGVDCKLYWHVYAVKIRWASAPSPYSR